jgi:hypothetical protein
MIAKDGFLELVLQNYDPDEVCEIFDISSEDLVREFSHKMYEKAHRVAYLWEEEDDIVFNEDADFKTMSFEEEAYEDEYDI